MDAKDKGERRETYKNTRESKKRNPSNKQLLLVYRIQGRASCVSTRFKMSIGVKDGRRRT